MNNQIIKIYKDEFENTYQRFQECLKNFNNFDNGCKKNTESISNNWVNLIKDKNWLQKFICLKNFQTVLNFKNKLSVKLSCNDLVNKVSQHFGEIDCAMHLLREFPKKIIIEKLIENRKSKICDFKIYSSPPHFVEVKVITKFTKSKLKEYTEKAINQIQDSANNDKNFYGVIWIFTYDIPNDINSVQSIVEEVKSDIKVNFKFYLTVQIYSLGLFGDSTFRFV